MRRGRSKRKADQPEEGLTVDDLRGAQLQIKQRKNISNTIKILEGKKAVALISDSKNANVKGSSSWEKGECVMVQRKKHKTLNKYGVSPEKKVDTELQKSCLASIVPENIKLVYLRRGLVENLLMQSDNIEDKVVGSFIGVKKGSGNGSGSTSYQLLQVTGIKRTPDVEINGDVFLRVSCMEPDVKISMLSDSDSPEELCEDLHQKVKDGLPKKHTVELQEFTMKNMEAGYSIVSHNIG